MKKNEHESQEIEQMLKEGVIEPPMSKWARPAVSVPKNDENLSFFVDYRECNAMKVRDTYQLLQIGESFDSLRDAALFFAAHRSSR